TFIPQMWHAPGRARVTGPGCEGSFAWCLRPCRPTRSSPLARDEGRDLVRIGKAATEEARDKRNPGADRERSRRLPLHGFDVLVPARCGVRIGGERGHARPGIVGASGKRDERTLARRRL